MIGTLWLVWAVLTVISFSAAMAMERSALKVDGAAGLVTFGWFNLFIVWGLPTMAVTSLLVWLVGIYL